MCKVGEGENSAEEIQAKQALTTFLTTATTYTWTQETDSPAIGNYAALSGLTVDGTTVTADLSDDTALVQTIMAKPKIGTTIGKEATFENVSDYYIMNTVSRYLAALYRTTGTPVAKIVYNNVTYSWTTGTDNGKGSKWVPAEGSSLVAEIVADNVAGISSFAFTIVDAEGNSVDVSFEVTAPKAPVIE